MAHEDIGDAALFVYNLSHHTHRRPYLRRNVRAALGALSMGSTLSRMSTIGAKARAREKAMDSDEDEDEQQPPAKRRKMSHLEVLASLENDDLGDCRRPFGQVMNESQRSSAKTDIINPVNFYGRYSTCSSDQPPKYGKMSKSSIESCLPGNPVDFAESMRVDILGINAEHDEPVPAETEWGCVAEISCRCAVAIYYAKNDQKPGDVKPSDFLEICRVLKPCKYRITIDDEGGITRDIISQPFVFTPDHFYVHRRTRKLHGQWDPHLSGFGFADKYSVKVFLESKGSSVTWPGMEITSASAANPIADLIANGSIVHEDVSFYARTNPWMVSEQPRTIDLHSMYKSTVQKTSHSLTMMIHWALPNRLNQPARKTSPKQASAPRGLFTAAPPPPGIPLKAEALMPPESPEDSRAARRSSSVPTYNLKALSSIAQGRSPRAPRAPRAQRSRIGQHADGEPSVTYCFGKAEAAESGIKRETTVVGLKCPFCLSRNRSLDELRLHLNTDHSAYKFHLCQPNPPRVTFFVELALAKSSRSGPLNMSETSRIIQLSRSTTLFDLESHLNGDETWLRARRGLQHNVWPGHPVEKRMVDSSHSSSPHDSRHSSPNTSNDTDDLMDVDKFEEIRPVKKRKIHYVPKINKPLFDPVTKRQLLTGEPLPNSDDETDESWLHQQRRDGINDFTDIPPEEKEYINQFNPYIIGEHLTSMKHLPGAMVRFVEMNKSWITEKVSRRQEFMKQMENFLLKGYVDERGVLEPCFRILIAEEQALKLNVENAGKDADDDVDMVQLEEEPATLKRGLQTCICGELTMPPNRILCHGTSCPARFFCRTCAESSERPIIGHWKCDSCSFSTGE